MATMQRWAVPMAVLGAVATGVGLTLLWLVLTRPVALAQALGGAAF
jgi:hypothetical protein